MIARYFLRPRHTYSMTCICSLCLPLALLWLDVVQVRSCQLTPAQGARPARHAAANWWRLFFAMLTGQWIGTYTCSSLPCPSGCVVRCRAWFE